MPYEEIQGEIMTMANNVDLGLSGTSTDYEGAQSQTFLVKWHYPGGISGINWSEINEQSIDDIAGSSESDKNKINSINGIVYNYVKTLLTTEGWDAFYDTYGGCIEIRM